MSASDFDFRKPPAGTLEKRLSGWLGEACSLALSKWARYLAFPAELELLKVEPLTTATALQRLPDGSISFRLAVEGHPDDAPLMAMSRQTILTMVGGTFGETYNALPPDRDLSAVEDSVTNFLIQQLLLDLLNATWPIADPLNLTIAVRGAPKAICTLPVNEMIVLATISFSGPFGSQPIFLFMPRTGILELLVRPATEEIQVDPADRQQMEELVREMPVDLSVVLGSAQLTLTQLASLDAGDVVILGQKVTEPLRAKVGGADKFQVWPGVVGRRQAVQIDSTVKR